jgi:hypothetical protein
MTKLLKKGQTCSHDDECKGCCLKDVCDHKSSYGCKKKLKDEKKVVKLPKTKTPKRTIEEIKQEIEKIRKKIVDSKDKKKEEKYIKKIEKLTKKIINLEKPKKTKSR